MDISTAAAIGTFVGSAIAAFSAQAWGNRKAEKIGEKVVKGTAAQTTSDEILKRVISVEEDVRLLKQSTPMQTKPLDHRSPKGD